MNFNEKGDHLTTYGLEIAERDKKTKKVTKIKCRFCIFFGREGKIGSKRKQSKQIKTFTKYKPFLFRQHIARCHPLKFEEYRVLELQDKLTFFNERLEFKATLTGHLDKSSVSF